MSAHSPSLQPWWNPNVEWTCLLPHRSAARAADETGNAGTHSTQPPWRARHPTRTRVAFAGVRAVQTLSPLDDVRCTSRTDNTLGRVPLTVHPLSRLLHRAASRRRRNPRILRAPWSPHVHRWSVVHARVGRATRDDGMSNLSRYSSYDDGGSCGSTPGGVPRSARV